MLHDSGINYTVNHLMKTTKQIFHTVAIGGTFDRLHKGHREFISRAFEAGERVVVGLTSNAYVQEKCKVQNAKCKIKVGSYTQRKTELEKFLVEKRWRERAEILEINDVYGNADKNPELEAIVVTDDSAGGARQINEARMKHRLKPLEIITAPLVLAGDEQIISSTRIRLGEIDRWGQVYGKLSLGRGVAAENLRNALKKPLGTLIPGKEDDLMDAGLTVKKKITELDPVMLITIGDEVTRIVNEMDLVMNLGIFDYHVKRKKIYDSVFDLKFRPGRSRFYVTVNNPAGNITGELWEAVRHAIDQHITLGTDHVIKVNGEDDLAGVPAILLAPLDSVVIYGQPGEGIVLVQVTEEKKKELVGILEKHG